VGNNPNDVALDLRMRTAFVPNTDDDPVSVLNLNTRTVTQTNLSARSSHVYVPNHGDRRSR
jgi:DNA-binding beta-propeller fold protein YncE